MAQGWLQIAIFLARRRGADAAARRLHGAASTGTSASSSRRCSAALERLTYRVARVDPDRGPGLEGLRAQPDRLLGPLLDRALRDPAHPGHPAVQPAGLRLRPLGRLLQHRLVVRDQHELAVLRRRDDAQLLQPDGRADRAELRLGGGRDGGRCRAHPRHHRTAAARASGTSGRTWSASMYYILLPLSIDRRAAAGLAGRAPDARPRGQP